MVTSGSKSKDFRTLPDILLLGFGVFGGGLAALMTVWLWFNYQADPHSSVLALVSTQFIDALPASLKDYVNTQSQIMGLPLAADTSAYWYMARAGGIVAYLLVWLSVVWGLVLSTKITGKMVSAPVAYGLHEFLSILTIVFALLHAGVLLGDNYIAFNIFHLIVPFVAPYEPLWTGLGVISLYLAMALTVSFYIRKLIGQKTWRLVHYLTFLAFSLVLLHGLMAGTDTPNLGIKLMYWFTGLSVLFLVYYRLFTLKVLKQ